MVLPAPVLAIKTFGIVQAFACINAGYDLELILDLHDLFVFLMAPQTLSAHAFLFELNDRTSTAEQTTYNTLYERAI